MTGSTLWLLLLRRTSTLDILRRECHRMYVASFGSLVGLDVIHLFLLVQTICFGDSLVLGVVIIFATLSIFDNVLSLNDFLFVCA